MTVSGSSNNNHISAINTPAEVRSAPAAEKASPAHSGPSSKVEVSDSAREMAEVARMVNEAPADRSELVDQIKSKIESGDYKVDLDKLAERMSDVI